MSQLWKPGAERPDYTQYPVNQLISNLQIQPSVKISYRERYYWKERAIKYAADALAALIPDLWRDGVTFVPIPPSKVDSDPEYDNRLLAILKAVRPRLPDTGLTSSMDRAAQLHRPCQVRCNGQVKSVF